ncbi:MAG: flagellar biosynthetic protein FliR [Polyangiaceae bacterium]
MTAPGIIEASQIVANARGVDLAALGVAWARALPTVILVPAFGLRALPMPLRAILGAVIAIAIFPAMIPLAASRAGEPPVLLAFEQIVAGTPIALATAIPLWAATMAGGAIDTARGADRRKDFPVIEKGSTELGVFFSLLASSIFLSTGGPARVANGLISAHLSDHPLVAAANDLSAGITASIAIAAPILVASIAIEVGVALSSRMASPLPIAQAMAPARTMAIFVMLALVLERIARVIAFSVR